MMINKRLKRDERPVFPKRAVITAGIPFCPDCQSGAYFYWRWNSGSAKSGASGLYEWSDSGISARSGRRNP